MLQTNLLTKTIADQFLRDPNLVQLNEFTAIDDEAACVLSRFDRLLNLDGLKSLSEPAAASLSQQKGDLSLSGMTELSEPVASLLSQHRGTLRLNGLMSLPLAIANLLSNYEGEVLEVDASSISDEAILILAPHDNIWVTDRGRDGSPPVTIPETLEAFIIARKICYDEATGVPYLSDAIPQRDKPLFGELNLEEATRLVSHVANGGPLFLNGWYACDSPEILKTLSQGNFSQIHLKFENITEEMARILSTFQAEAIGIECENVDQNAAHALLKFPGRYVGARGIKSAFRWSQSCEVFQTHHSMQHWGKVQGLDSIIEIEAQCSVCGVVMRGKASVGSIVKGEGFRGMLSENYDSEIMSGAGGHEFHHWGPGICNDCREDYAPGNN